MATLPKIHMNWTDSTTHARAPSMQRFTHSRRPALSELGRHQRQTVVSLSKMTIRIILARKIGKIVVVISMIKS